MTHHSFVLCSQHGIPLSSSYNKHLSGDQRAKIPRSAISKLIASTASIFSNNSDKFTFEWNQLKFSCVSMKAQTCVFYSVLFHNSEELPDEESMNAKHSYLQYAVHSLFTARQLEEMLSRCEEFSSCDGTTFADTVSDKNKDTSAAEYVLSDRVRDRFEQFEDHIVRVVLDSPSVVNLSDRLLAPLTSMPVHPCQPGVGGFNVGSYSPLIAASRMKSKLGLGDNGEGNEEGGGAEFRIPSRSWGVVYILATKTQPQTQTQALTEIPTETVDMDNPGQQMDTISRILFKKSVLFGPSTSSSNSTPKKCKSSSGGSGSSKNVSRNSRISSSRTNGSSGSRNSVKNGSKSPSRNSISGRSGGCSSDRNSSNNNSKSRSSTSSGSSSNSGEKVATVNVTASAAAAGSNSSKDSLPSLTLFDLSHFAAMCSRHAAKMARPTPSAANSNTLQSQPSPLLSPNSSRLSSRSPLPSPPSPAASPASHAITTTTILTPKPPSTHKRRVHSGGLGRDGNGMEGDRSDFTVTTGGAARGAHRVLSVPDTGECSVELTGNSTADHSNNHNGDYSEALRLSIAVVVNSRTLVLMTVIRESTVMMLVLPVHRQHESFESGKKDIAGAKNETNEKETESKEREERQREKAKERENEREKEGANINTNDIKDGPVEFVSAANLPRYLTTNWGALVQDMQANRIWFLNGPLTKSDSVSGGSSNDSNIDSSSDSCRSISGSKTSFGFDETMEEGEERCEERFQRILRILCLELTGT